MAIINGNNTILATLNGNRFFIDRALQYCPPIYGYAVTQAAYDQLTPETGVYYAIISTATGESITAVLELTQEQYDAMIAHDAATLYIISEGGSISDVFVGDTECDKLYQGSTELWTKANEYRYVEYIGVTGTQCIETDILVTNFNWKTIAEFDPGTSYNASETWKLLLGTSDNKYTLYAGYQTNISGYPQTQFSFYLGYTAADPSVRKCYSLSFAGDASRRNIITMLRGNSTVVFPNSGTTESCPANATITATTPTTVFRAFGTPSSPWSYNKLRCCYIKIYDENDVLIHELLPVERQSDMVLGLLDTITNEFYINAGTGTFEKGGYIT